MLVARKSLNFFATSQNSIFVATAFLIAMITKGSTPSLGADYLYKLLPFNNLCMCFFLLEMNTCYIFLFDQSKIAKELFVLGKKADKRWKVIDTISLKSNCSHCIYSILVNFHMKSLMECFKAKMIKHLNTSHIYWLLFYLTCLRLI